MLTNPYSLRYALKSHPGKVRPLNEDAVGAHPCIGLFVLCDGLGGYNAGEIAATMAVSSLLAGLDDALALAHAGDSGFQPEQALAQALVSRNESIHRAASHSSMYEGMATTAVVAWFLGDRLWTAHAGDSRMYRWRHNELLQITRDHSFSQELLDAGMITEDEARQLPAKNLVTRAIGASPELQPEINQHAIVPGDQYLLCSDGLTEMIEDSLIAAILAGADANLALAAQRLVDAAIVAGGRDNCSVVLVRADPIEAPPPV
jgi:protein phosphatase